MFRKGTLIGVALLVVTLLLLADRAEAVVFGIKPPQNFCSSKSALQIGKCTLSGNDLAYSMKHAVLSSSVTSISQGCIGMTEAVYMMELLSGLVGTYLIGYWGGLYVAAIMHYVVLPHFGLEDPEGPPGIYSYYFGYCPMVAIGAATGTSFAGLFFRPRGSFSGALIGAALGVATATLGQLWRNLSFWYLFPCASAGAVIGYNYKRFFLEQKVIYR